MEKIIKETIKTIYLTVSALFAGQTGASTSETGKMESSTEEDNITCQTGNLKLVNGHKGRK
jgi:hypothetical protein